MQKIIKLATLGLGFVLSVMPGRQTPTHVDTGRKELAQSRRKELARPSRTEEAAHGRGRRKKPKTPAGRGANPPAPKVRQPVKQCAPDLLYRRLFDEYGPVFAVNKKKAVPPPRCFFHNEAEIESFWKRAGSTRAIIGGIPVELQPQAMNDLLAAINEAKQKHILITPRGADASKRNYADTVKLWHGRFESGLKHWIRYGKITKSEADRARKLSTEQQGLKVLEWEAAGLYFGNGFGKSILESVAFPGSSQHNSMLAFDVKQYDNPQVQLIMARHGWFQTVKNDEPHFTYLGVKESALASLGLKADRSGGRVFWTVKSKAGAKEVAAVNEKDDSARNRGQTVAGDQKSDNTKSSKGASATGHFLSPFALAQLNLHAQVSPQALITKKMEPLLLQLTHRYFESSNRSLYITSGYRSPERQALAMYYNLIKFGVPYVSRTYKGRTAALEIIEAYRANRSNPALAARAMTAVIQAQIKRGVYISNHMLERAFDIRLSSAKLALLREVARSLGGTVVLERDHYHVGF